MKNKRKEFGRKLIEIREKKGLRQSDVADISFISQRSIGRLERGEVTNPSIDSLMELSKVYDKDIISLYIATVYESYTIFNEIKNKLNLNAMLLTKEDLNGLEEKVEIIKESKDLISKQYDIKLYELFIKYLKGEISDLALELIFDEINSNKINKKDFSYISLSAIELRILLNIATNADSYKNIDKVEIMNRCINQEENREVKIAASNNLANFYRRNNKFSNANEIINRGLYYTKKDAYIIGSIYLYYNKFAILYKANKNYEDVLTIVKFLLKYSYNQKLNNLISYKINKLQCNKRD